MRTLKEKKSPRKRFEDYFSVCFDYYKFILDDIQMIFMQRRVSGFGNFATFVHGL